MKKHTVIGGGLDILWKGSLQYVDESGIWSWRLSEIRLWVVSPPRKIKEAFKTNIKDE